MTPQGAEALSSSVDDVGVDRGALLEGAVELDLADLAAQRRLRELDDREAVVGDAVGGLARIEHLQVEHAVDADLHVVARDADLLGDVHRLFLEVVLVGDAVEEGLQDVEPGLDRAVVAAERLDDEGALLGHDDRGLRDDDDDDKYDDADGVSGFHACDYSALMCKVRPSTCAITASRPGSIGCRARVAGGPARTPVLHPAGLAGLEPRVHDDAVADGQPLVDVPRRSAQHFVHAAPERDHRDDGQHRERQPLGPVRQVDSDEAEKPDDRGRQADEHEVELRVDDEHLDAEQADPQHHPRPPRHPGPLARRRATPVCHPA